MRSHYQSFGGPGCQRNPHSAECKHGVGTCSRAGSMHDDKNRSRAKKHIFWQNGQKRAPGGPRPPLGPFFTKNMVFDMSRSQSIVHINSSYLNVD